MFWLEIMIQVIDNYRKRRFRKVIVKLLLPLQFICMCIEIFIFQICLEKALVRSSLQRGYARGYYRFKATEFCSAFAHSQNAPVAL